MHLKSPGTIWVKNPDTIYRKCIVFIALAMFCSQGKMFFFLGKQQVFVFC